MDDGNFEPYTSMLHVFEGNDGFLYDIMSVGYWIAGILHNALYRQVIFFVSAF